MKAFKAPDDTIGPTDAVTAAALITTATDFAIVVDGDGIIQDLAFQETDLSAELEGAGRWYGRQWAETVAPNSQAKVAALIREAETNATSRWRQLTHFSTQGRDVPVLYATVRLGSTDRIVALGRDLRATSALRQRLVDAQMAMERDYAKLRFAETRYRVLFQTASEPVVVLDAASSKIIEANPAAAALTASVTKRAAARLFTDLFDAASRPSVQAALTELRIAQKVDDTVATLVDGRPVTLSASIFRQDTASLVLARLAPNAPQPARIADSDALADFARAAPDGLVICDGQGRVMAANATFAAMVQLAQADDARGRMLDQWFGRSGVDLDVLIGNLRQHGSVRLFATNLRADNGEIVDVEVSAVTLSGERQPTFGFAVRDVGRRLGTAPAAQAGAPDLPHSASELTELIGRVSLKDLVRETTDVIEKLCIEKALERTGDNRASAAEMLGLSRQSLYVKLRRFGFADALGEDEVES